MEYLQNNTITHIVNCWAKEFPCKYSKKGIKYLDLNWPESNSDEISRLFDRFLPVVEEFIEKAESKCESVLIFCSNGQNRSLCIVVSLLIKRFRWSFYKTLEFLDSKRPNLEINKNYFGCLKLSCEKYEKWNKISSSWESPSYAELKFLEEENIVRNTFINSKNLNSINFISNFKDGNSFRKSKLTYNKSLNSVRIAWADPLISRQRKAAKSLGKTVLKKSFNENQLSLEPKKRKEKLNLRTEVEESFKDDTDLYSEKLKIGESGRSKCVSEKSKSKKSENLKMTEYQFSEFLKLKEDKISKFLASVSSTQKAKIKSEAELGEKKTELNPNKMANSSNEFYKKNLKEFNKKIFAKPAETIREIDNEKGHISKISTNSQDETKQTPNISDSSQAQQNNFTGVQFKPIRPIKTMISSFKERNNNDTFQEIHKSSKTVYHKDDFCREGEALKQNRFIEKGLEQKMSEPTNQEKFVIPIMIKNNEKKVKDESKQIDINYQLKNLVSDRLLKLGEVLHPNVNIKSNEKNETQKGKLIQNKANRPSSAPIKEDQREILNHLVHLQI